MLTFEDKNGDGKIDSEIAENGALSEIISRHQYYAFGMEMDGLWSNESDERIRYTYNGKEEVDEDHLGVLDYGARFYDSSIARFTTVDPLAEDYTFQTPYAYAANNPIKYIDWIGMGPEHIIVGENDDGTYKITGGKRDGDRGIYLDDGNGGKGEKIGMTATDYSFFLENDEVVKGANIDLNSSEGQDFLYEIIDSDISLRKYASNSRGGQPLDFKTNDIDERSPGISPQQYKHRGSKLADGTIASARDVGNIAAGVVAGKNGLSWRAARFGFDALESWQQRGNFNTSTGPFVIEGAVSRTAQYKGYELGVFLRNNPVSKNGPKSTYKYKVN